MAIDPPSDATSGTPLLLPLPGSGHTYSWRTLDEQDIAFEETVSWTVTFLNGGVLNPQDIAECYLVVGMCLRMPE